MPLNVMDAHYDSFEHRVLPVLVGEQIGVLGMKPLGSGAVLRSLTVTATEALQYAMSLPTSVVITGCERMQDLEQAIAAAAGFRPLAPQRVARLLARTASAGANGRFEPYKTTRAFDGTVAHPELLG